VSQPNDTEILARLMDLAARYGMEELEVEEAGLKIRLTAARGPGDEDDEHLTPTNYLPLWSPRDLGLPTASPAEATRSETARPLAAPLTGTFYRAPDPQSGPFVELGATVEEGQTVGIIEAMKVFSDVKAEFAGTIVEFVAANGRTVQHGEVLMYIEPGH
jgi:acetyl-CoA carboxylase biotin carboxyl carrier protein